MIGPRPGFAHGPGAFSRSGAPRPSLPSPSLPCSALPTSIWPPGRRRRVAAFRRRAGKAQRGAFPAPIPAPGGDSRPLDPCFTSSAYARRTPSAPASLPLPGRQALAGSGPGCLPPRSSTSRGPHDLPIRVACCGGATPRSTVASRMGRSAPPRGLRAGSLDVFVAGRLFRRYAKRDRAGARTAPPQALASRGLSRFVERGRA